MKYIIFCRSILTGTFNEKSKIKTMAASTNQCPPTGLTTTQVQQQQGPPWTMVKCGWIKKYKTRKSKYFVLSKDSNGNVYLEYFESEKKSRIPTIPTINNSGNSRKISLTSSSSTSSKHDNRRINVTDTFYIQKRKQRIKNKDEYIVDIFTRTDVFVLLFDDSVEQTNWFDTLMKEKVEWFNKNRNDLPEVMFEDTFDHVWQVTVTKKGIGSESGLSGLNRLCFTSKTSPNMVYMFKVEPSNQQQSHLPPSKSTPANLSSETTATLAPQATTTLGVYNQRGFEIHLNQVRKVARNGNMFHIELGRSSTIGEGALFMMADEISATNMHEIIRNAMSNKSGSSSNVTTSLGGQRTSVCSLSHSTIAQPDGGGHYGQRSSRNMMIDEHGHTSSPASSPPSMTILESNPRSNSFGYNDSSSLSRRGVTSAKDSDSCQKKKSYPSDENYVAMGPLTPSEAASSMEETGYLDMNVSKGGASSSLASSLDQDGTGYLDMSPISSSLSGITGTTHQQQTQHSYQSGQHGPRSRAGTSGSTRSNERRSRTGKRDPLEVGPPEPPSMIGGTEDNEFRLEKVKCFLEESSDGTELHIPPVRAYSIGSRPTATTYRSHFMPRHGGQHNIIGTTLLGSSNSVGTSSSTNVPTMTSVTTTNVSSGSHGHQRVRSNTVGSRPPTFSPQSLSAASSSTSSHLLLSSTSKLTSSSNDHMDHMEIDYTNSSSVTATPSLGPPSLGVRKLSQGHRARSDSKSSTSSTTSASLKVKESCEPWEVHLPSSLALHSSPGHPSTASIVSKQSTNKSSSAAKVVQQKKETTLTATDLTSQVVISSADNNSADSSASSATISSPTTSTPLIGPVRPPGHGKSGQKSSSTISPSTTTSVSRSVSQPSSTATSTYPSLPCLPEQMMSSGGSGSIGSMSSLKKETVDGQQQQEQSKSGDNDKDVDDDTVQYTVIQFNPTTTSS